MQTPCFSQPGMHGIVFRQLLHVLRNRLVVQRLDQHAGFTNDFRQGSAAR